MHTDTTGPFFIYVQRRSDVQGIVEDAVAIDIGTTADEKTEKVLDRPEGGHGLDVDPKRWLPEQPQDDEQPPAVVADKKTEE